MELGPEFTLVRDIETVMVKGSTSVLFGTI